MSQVSFVSPALLRGPVEKLQVLVLSVTVSRQIRGASDLKKNKKKEQCINVSDIKLILFII